MRARDAIRLAAATAGGAGLLPLGPGTWGSLVGLGAIALLPSDGRYLPWALGLAVAASLGCVALGRWAEAHFARKDPPAFVLDEVAGMLVAALGTERPPLHWCAVAFVLFRYFDIRKPAGIARLQRVRGGLGILLDDLAAGAAALAIGQGCRALARAFAHGGAA